MSTQTTYFCHNPYAFKAISDDDMEVFDTPAVPAQVVAPLKEVATLDDDGVSEVSSKDLDAICSGPRSSSASNGDTPSVEQTSLIPPSAAPSTLRYASVNFRFGSAWFLAPFRTAIGEMVVVEYPGTASLHMGLVAAITTEKPETFYSDENPHPNFLTEEEKALLPRLLRHARDFDRETKLQLRQSDLRSLDNARALAVEMGAPIDFLDAEWLLDYSAVTFLVEVYGDVEKVDQLADDLAMQEGAEVVFTFPTCY